MNKMQKINDDYRLYLSDESRLQGRARAIVFPESEDDIAAAVRECRKSGEPLTIQGARTGISGGAVPEGGVVCSLEKMKSILSVSCHEEDGSYIFGVEPGLLLQELRSLLMSKDIPEERLDTHSRQALQRFKAGGDYFFPTDPTEASASIGGMTASNASGARSFLYGPVRNYIRGLSVLTAEGDLLRLVRGRDGAKGGRFRLQTDSGRIISGGIPELTMPSTKNTAGYFLTPDMDMADLFIGSEGTLGIISRINIVVIPRPKYRSGVFAFFPGEGEALRFVEALRSAQTFARRPVKGAAKGAALAAVEYFGPEALRLLRLQKETNEAFSDIPDISGDFHASVYFELEGNDGEDMEEAVFSSAELMTEAGGSEEDTWIADRDEDIERFKFFRHALPEAVNMQIDSYRKKDPSLTKLGTDMAVPDGALRDIVRVYRDGLKREGLEAVIFGHIGDNHLHVNILPRSREEYERGRRLYHEWAGAVVDFGGSISAEHGVGKLKKDLLAVMFDAEELEVMRNIKKCFDSQGIFNRGTIF